MVAPFVRCHFQKATARNIRSRLQKIDRLLAAEPRDKAAKNAPKDKVLDKWDLGQLIKVAVELKLVEPVAETLANAVRQYRNLVHPDAELRNELRVEKLEADSGLTVFRTVCRDLERVHPDRNRRHARIVVPDCPRSMIRWSPVLGYRRDRCFGGVAKPIRRIFESVSSPLRMTVSRSAGSRACCVSAYLMSQRFCRDVG